MEYRRRSHGTVGRCDDALDVVRRGAKQKCSPSRGYRLDAQNTDGVIYHGDEPEPCASRFHGDEPEPCASRLHGDEPEPWRLELSWASGSRFHAEEPGPCASRFHADEPGP
jgi:hypothetical protein